MTKPKKVLVVDASRVVRASLVKYLRGNFDVCEESNGESAWQSIVLDSSIVAVLSGLDINKLEGADLVERIRASKLLRLNRLPFFLLASHNFSESEKARARKLGVSDFVPKASAEQAIEYLFGKLAKPESAHRDENEVVVSLVASQVRPVNGEYGGQSEIGLSDFMSRIGRLDTLSGEASATESASQGAVDDRRQANPLAGQNSPSSVNGGEPVGVVVFGLDAYKDFVSRYGQELADKVVMKFSKLLTGKIRGEESIVHLADGYIAIVSPTADRDQCSSFAGRVCKALAKAHISVRGQRVETTVSVGVAAIPEETGETSTKDLLKLAVNRLEKAIGLGGNQAIFGSVCGAKPVSQEEFFGQLKAMLATAPPDSMMSCKSWMNYICFACRQARQNGEPSLCRCDPTGGHCGQCAGTAS